MSKLEKTTDKFALGNTTVALLRKMGVDVDASWEMLSCAAELGEDIVATFVTETGTKFTFRIANNCESFEMEVA